MTTALEFYTERIKNFENERSLVDDHIKLIAPDKVSIHCHSYIHRYYHYNH